MTISGNTRIATRFLLGASLIAVASPALAQDSEGEDGGLGEIVVTAQKREQNLQDVPIAISALSAEKVEQLGIRDARDLSGLAPNVTIVQGTTSSGAAVISIRGIPTPASETFGLDTANGLYVDGIYIGRSGASALDVMDIERVEVLRGPQGTLFGRNTTGGGIAFISRKPSEELRVRAEAGYGNYGAWSGKLSVDPGRIMGIDTSFSYSHRERNGVVDNILQADKSRDPGARQSDAFRFAARTELGGTGSVQYIFDWAKTDAAPINFQLTNVADGTVRAPLVVGGQPVVVTSGAAVQQYLAGATFAQAECRALATPTRVWQEKVCNDISSTSMDKTWGHNLQVENDFDAFQVKLTAGYRFWNNDSNTDLDGMGAFRGPQFTNASLFNGFPAALLQNLGFPAGTSAFLADAPVPTVSQNLFDTNNQRRHKQFSQELEISGDTDTLDWVLGGFYFWEKGSENNPQNSGFVLDTNSAIFSDAAFVGVLRGVGFPAATAAAFAPVLAPSFRATNPARYRMVQTLARLRYQATAESTAVYGQATLYPGGRDSGLRLTAGGRYSWDNKSMVRFQNGTAAVAVPERGSASFSKFTWNLMLGYDIADGISTYARAATGYRSGGFNAQDPINTATNQLDAFKPESVTSYEVGVKSELFGRRLRLNVAGYYNEYKDLAVNIPRTDAPAGTFATRVGNAGKVTYTGFEIEAQAKLSQNFTLEGNLGYVDIKIKELLAGQSTTPGAPPVNVASISHPGYTSPFTANAALNFQFPLGSGELRLVGRASYTYEDGKYSFSNIIGTPFNDALKGDSRNIVDAQIGVDRIALGGGEGEIKLWVKNLTNSHDFARAIDFGALGYAGGYFADPRTYGVTVGVKF
ncbi:TonB-dependent receptor [Novosphingobium sp.]|uniref:TonB-dependent receptor n=1 Tax=Novosphingobium sp. TaxID=1874826 RepID=UPI002733A0CB|nr:TonB-dependent receptor [Novosphingobium sp.]MDP3907407.1 TonB-dependent receptor [Novosphingobium sp.]